MKRTRTESQYRVVEEAEYKGHRIRAVCGYNIVGDNFLVHLYITPPTGPEISVFDVPRHETHLEDALNLAFFEARSEVDQLMS